MDSTQTGVSQGKTYYSDAQTPPTTYTADTIKLEGKIIYVEDREVGSGGVRGALRSGRMVKATVVRNDSSVDWTALPRRAVSWKATYRGRRFDGYTTTTNAEIAGIVDPHLSGTGVAGIRKGDLGLIYDLSGPVEGLTSLAGNGENVIGEAAFVGALTAATSQATTAGRLVAAATTSSGIAAVTDGTDHAKFRFARAQAMTARTTANTNASVLIGIV